MPERGKSKLKRAAASGPARPAAPRAIPPTDRDPVSLCEALDRVLHKGVCVRGDLTISVAGIELVYVGLNALIASVETARQVLHDAPSVAHADTEPGARA